MPDVFSFLTHVTQTTPIAHGVRLQTANAVLTVEAVSEAVFRVVTLPGGGNLGDLPHSYALDPADTSDAPAVELQEDEERITLNAGEWKVRLRRDPLRLDVLSPDGYPFARDGSGPGWLNGRFHVWKAAAPEARYYGVGEKAYPLERSGRAFTNWNTDAPGYAPEADPLYKSIPFFLCVEPRPGRAPFSFGIFLDNSHRSHFDFGGQSLGQYVFGADGGPIRYYVIGGPSPADVLRRYTRLTGRTPLPPRWALGYHQSRWSYFPDAEVRHLVDRCRSRRFPLDVVHLDIHHMHDYRIFTWDPQRFPEPSSLLSDLRENGVRAVIIVDPGVKTDSDYRVAREGLDGDHFVRYPDGSIYEGKVWPGNCYFPDFTRSATRTWFGSFCQKALDEGVAGFWTDMNEPSNHGYRTLPDHVVHEMDGEGGSHLAAHNVYGHLMTQSVFDAALAHRPEERPFVLTRAAFAGTQRYAAVWTGDNVSSWEHLRLAVPMLLSLGLSGIPFAGTDVGGFFGSPTPELFVRWMQLGALTPLLRTHSIFNSPRQEPWSFGEVAEDAARRAVELRYRLLPYLYSVFHEHTTTGLPIMRPLFLHYPEDEEVARIDDQFLLGEHILAAPVLRQGAEARSLYLPRGRWHALSSGKRFDGPQWVTVPAPLAELPLFVRAGTCLAMGPVLQHVEERPVQEWRLEVFAGEGTTSVYEDDGTSHAYRNGEYRMHHFLLEGMDSALRLSHKTTGNFSGEVARFIVVLRGEDTAHSPQTTLELDARFDEVRLPLAD